jgi:hypothetical protein
MILALWNMLNLKKYIKNQYIRKCPYYTKVILSYVISPLFTMQDPIIFSINLERKPCGV